MTPLEDRIRQALRGEAGDIPPGTAPPLRLPARRRRFFSLPYGGGERKEASAAAWRGWLVPVVAAVVVAAVIAGVLAVSRALPARGRPGGDPQAAAAAINEAAAWTAAQVSRSATVSCDPVICQALAAHHIPAADLDVLKPDVAEPPRSDVIVATPLVRREFGARLSSVYAPVILASFGSGRTRVDIRLIAPGGAAAYRSELRADQQGREAAGRQLSDNQRIRMSAVARRQMLAGQVDSRLLTLLAALVTIHPVSVVAFGDSGPGAARGVPLRSVELATTRQTVNAVPPLTVRGMLALVNRQLPPFRPARAGEIRLRDGETVIRIEFAAPSPLGLLGSAQVRDSSCCHLDSPLTSRYTPRILDQMPDHRQTGLRLPRRAGRHRQRNRPGPRSALASLSRTWAAEFAQNGVRVNSAAPRSGPSRRPLRGMGDRVQNPPGSGQWRSLGWSTRPSRKVNAPGRPPREIDAERRVCTHRTRFPGKAVRWAYWPVMRVLGPRPGTFKSAPIGTVLSPLPNVISDGSARRASRGPL